MVAQITMPSLFFYSQMKTRILLLEGHEELGPLFQKAMSRFGYQCQATDCFIQFFTSFLKAHTSDRPYPLILVDCDLPNHTGQEITSMIRRIERDSPRHIPAATIIGLTHRPEFGSEDGKRVGMDEVFPKPVNGQDLWRIIEPFAEAKRLPFFSSESGV